MIMSAAADVHGARDVGHGYSSSSSLSSAHSPNNIISPSLSAAQPAHVLPSQNDNHRDGNVGGEKATKSSLAKYNTSGPKKTRKKREPYNKNESKSSTTTATDGREPVPKVRKTRGPYNTSSHSTAGRKKKVVPESNPEPIPPPAQHLPRQSKITETVRSPLPPHDFGVLASPPPHQNGNNEVIAKSNIIHTLPAPTPRSSSGQNYDPIRSATIEPRTMSPLLLFNPPVRSSTPPRPPQKYASASASPSIASLIEPASSNQAYNFPKPPKRNNEIKPPSSPTSKKARLSPPPPTSIYEIPKTITTNPYGANVPSINEKATPPADMDMDPARQVYNGPTSTVKISNSTSTGASSAAHSPKPSRPKEPLVAVPSGNGLLSSAMFGGAYDGTGPEKAAPTVILHVSLDGGDNKYVNFARMAEERYGFNALHPRLAAQRERLARVAAAGAAIENAHKVRNSGSGVSGDEMSVDLSENDLGGDDSNMEMGGTSLNDIEMGGVGRSGGEGSEATLVKKAPKKRLMREDYYDKDDPFVDDTELAWEEQAAASKDGFFVYSGPLVPEGEKAVVERYVGPRSFLLADANRFIQSRRHDEAWTRERQRRGHEGDQRSRRQLESCSSHSKTQSDKGSEGADGDREGCARKHGGFGGQADGLSGMSGHVRRAGGMNVEHWDPSEPISPINTHHAPRPFITHFLSTTCHLVPVNYSTPPHLHTSPPSPPPSFDRGLLGLISRTNPLSRL